MLIENAKLDITNKCIKLFYSEMSCLWFVFLIRYLN